MIMIFPIVLQALLELLLDDQAREGGSAKLPKPEHLGRPVPIIPPI